MKIKYFAKQLIGVLLFFAIIFISAGRIQYWHGLAYVAIGLIMMILSYTVFQIDSQLSEERSKVGSGAKKWDKAIMGISFFITLGMYIVGGLDSGRYHWSPDFHWSVFLSGALLTAGGQLMFLIAQKQNKFFSSIVRIQTERGHTVCDSGLYKFVRHPAYLGSIIQALGFPLLMGSLWSIIPVCILVILFFIRTALEDKTLQNELNGYADYLIKTPYRIFPFIW